jgi:hypothetical protein
MKKDMQDASSGSHATGGTEKVNAEDLRKPKDQIVKKSHNTGTGVSSNKVIFKGAKPAKTETVCTGVYIDSAVMLTRRYFQVAVWKVQVRRTPKIPVKTGNASL